MTKEQLDAIDRELISLLRKDGRAAVSWLSQKIGVSRATIQNRMAKLQKQEIIKGYTAIIADSADRQASTIRALMSIELAGNVSDKVRHEINKEPDIIAMHSTNGRWDLILEMRTRSLEEFDRLLGRVRSINGVKASETNILLSTMRMAP